MFIRVDLVQFIISNYLLMTVSAAGQWSRWPGRIQLDDNRCLMVDHKSLQAFHNGYWSGICFISLIIIIIIIIVFILVAWLVVVFLVIIIIISKSSSI